MGKDGIDTKLILQNGFMICINRIYEKATKDKIVLSGEVEQLLENLFKESENEIEEYMIRLEHMDQANKEG